MTQLFYTDTHIHDLRLLVTVIKSSHEMGCMLTVRLQSKAGKWIWVNMVMHIRQPFVCDNGDPAIVCINHVIRDSEAELFKLQSQLYSSHIAQSPEFMGPPQGASPSHTITQVPVERQYTVTGTYVTLPHSGQEERSFPYSGEFQEVSSSSEEVSTVVGGGGGGGDHLTQLRTSIGSSAESSPEQTEQGDRRTVLNKQNIREDVLNRLKRKINDINSPCRPHKRPRSSTSSPDGGLGSGGSNITLQTNILAGPGFLDDLVNSYSGGDVQVVGGIHNAPMYHHIKKEIEVHPMAKSPPMLDQSLPLSPLTPQSMSSESGLETIHPGSMQLKIDVDTAVVPLSVLTPEASPANSPAYSTTTSPPYQTAFDNHLPTELFAQLEDKSFYPPIKEEKKVKKAQLKPVLALAKQENLPELDLNILAEFFDTVETKSEARRAAAQRLRVHQAVAMPTMVEKEEVIKMVPSPVLELERQQSAVNTVCPSPQGDDTCLSHLSDDQLNRLVASVTDTILDMVSSGEPCQAPALTPAQPQMPTHAPTKEDELMDLSSILAEDSIILSPSHGDALLSSHEELCVELHQLNELASSGPSYGTYLFRYFGIVYWF